MPFDDKLKSEARKKAAFRCCLCREPRPLHVHHIIPEEDGGPNTLDNAAPLCPNCHTGYGHDRSHQRMIREARDTWFQTVERKWGAPYGEKLRSHGEQLNTIAEIVGRIERGQEEFFPQFKKEAINLFRSIIEGAEVGDTIELSQALIPMSTGTIVTEFLECKECGRSTTSLTGGLCSECYAKQNPNK